MRHSAVGLKERTKGAAALSRLKWASSLVKELLPQTTKNYQASGG